MGKSIGVRMFAAPRPGGRVWPVLCVALLGLVACGGGGGGGAGAGTGGAAASAAGATSTSGSGSSATSGGGGSSGNPASGQTATVTITVNAQVHHAISPYIYGLNSYGGYSGAPAQLTMDRAGGNRWTAYNWETNASNAGSDYLYENDDYLTSSTTPAAAITPMMSADAARGMASLVTFQLQGLVAGDESGPVTLVNAPDLSRFKHVVYQKSTQSGAPFTTNPPTTDDYVYMDEFLWALNQDFLARKMFSSAPSGPPVFIELDNEPELWNSTHQEIQGTTGVTYTSYIANTITLARALKTQFPDVTIFGPVHYGFEGIYNWQGELSATPTGNNWFPDKYLPAIHSAGQSFGHPLVDVYDFHWYSEATDGSGNRVINLPGPSLSAVQVQAIVQSPRSLWDTSFTENSWITADVLGGPIELLPRLSSRIASENAGMKIAITEYNNGGAKHIAGTLALADNLGIFGAEGLFAASYWPLSSSEPYPIAGFRAYRDFDGAGANFGDTSLQASSSDTSKVAVYVSSDSTHAGRYVLVAINRSTVTQVAGINGLTLSGTAHVFNITASSAQGQATIKPVAVVSFPVAGSSLKLALPALSVSTVEIQ